MRTLKVKRVGGKAIMVLSIVLEFVVVVEIIALVLAFRNEKQLAIPGRPAGGSYIVQGYDEQSSDIVKDLQVLDIMWLEKSNLEVSSHLEAMMASEAGRRELAKQKAETQAALWEEQQRLQAELNAKAEADILAMGGTDVTRSNEVYISEAPDVSESPVIVAPETPGETGAPSSETPAVEEDIGYLGQFNAKFVCTCASCFKESEWLQARAGDNFVLASPEYIPVGTKVTLDQGSTAEYDVRDGGEKTLGRDVIVFCSNHTETNGGQTLFPKIYKKD